MTDSATMVGGRPSGGGRRLSWSWLGALPFFVYVGLFLLLPTLVVVFGAFVDPSGRPTTANLSALGQDFVVTSFKNSIVLSAESGLIGALLGAVVAYAIATGRPEGGLRRTFVAASGMLAQSGGVTLAFAFIATIGGEGFITVLLRGQGIDVSPTLLFGLSGLTIVYAYFQIPLMVLVFLPALDGIRPQWREATETLGGTSWHYWRHVAVPILTPPFLGALLLLFANAFSAYATAAALISQGSIIAPLQIRVALTSETIAGQENVGKAIALGMIVVVGVVMALYTLLERRSARWLKK
ncbi:ABC transporter permease subunit [Kineosporia sp. R_H_3]|uniref:ABC transporter permease n=1 Tax=Kineosporia sp. R_H_3 TaxID=1961848 RepID=UPI001E3DF228|nr:ABC transporter permease subunit [Kineosporia sp. R_H_3]